MTEFKRPHFIRDDIIELFIQQGGSAVSGEQLSQGLGLSRTAVWKQVKALEDFGFQFEAAPRVGYRLVKTPDELMEPLVKPFIPSGIALGHAIWWESERESTNQAALELARAGAPHGVVVTTGKQTGGRGRHGRIWASPQGGMWFSVLVRNPCALSQAADLTLLASVAVTRVLREFGVPAEIKWPNDILLGGRKICGILAQMRTDGERVDYAVIGIGINANFTDDLLPQDMKNRPTTILSSIGRPIPREQVLARILTELSVLYEGLAKGNGFGEVRDEWVKYSHSIGRTIQVQIGDNKLTGVAENVDHHGVLYLRDESGTIHPIHSGEVLFSSRERV